LLKRTQAKLDDLESRLAELEQKAPASP
jgi:BMFP domain-containing protein YqiC